MLMCGAGGSVKFEHVSAQLTCIIKPRDGCLRGSSSEPLPVTRLPHKQQHTQRYARTGKIAMTDSKPLVDFIRYHGM